MWRRGKRGEEVKIPKPLEERRQEEGGGASWVEEQVGRYGKGEGSFDRRQAEGGGYVQEENTSTGS